MKQTFLFLLGFFCTTLAFAQTPDPFGDALRRMNDQMMRGLPFGDSSAAHSQFFSFPADSSFSFHFDTTFSNGSRSFFFHFSPMPGTGSQGNMADPMGLQQMMQQFFNFGQGFDNPFFMPNPGGSPSDDGNQQPSDGLLPEERLRQGQQPEQKTTPARPAPKPKPKKEDEIKTIRI